MMQENTKTSRLALLVLLLAAFANDVAAQCVIVDIDGGEQEFERGTLIRTIGIECIDDASYKGQSEICGADGAIERVEDEELFTCEEGTTCAQCGAGPRRGGALCLPGGEEDLPEDCSVFDEGYDDQGCLVGELNEAIAVGEEVMPPRILCLEDKEGEFTGEYVMYTYPCGENLVFDVEITEDECPSGTRCVGERDGSEGRCEMDDQNPGDDPAKGNEEFTITTEPADEGRDEFGVDGEDQDEDLVATNEEEDLEDKSETAEKNGEEVDGCIVDGETIDIGDTIGEVLKDCDGNGVKLQCGTDGTIVEVDINLSCGGRMSNCVLCDDASVQCLETDDTSTCAYDDAEDLDRPKDFDGEPDDLGEPEPKEPEDEQFELTPTETNETGTCLDDDVTYKEGEIMSEPVGEECLEDGTGFSGFEKMCKAYGKIGKNRADFPCPESRPNCVQCGDAAPGAAICAPTNSIDNCDGEVEEEDEVKEDTTSTVAPMDEDAEEVGEEGCVVGGSFFDIGRSVGEIIGLSCIGTSGNYEGIESKCESNGIIVDIERVFSCEEGTPYCVECGIGFGAARCSETNEKSDIEGCGGDANQSNGAASQATRGEISAVPRVSPGTLETMSVLVLAAASSLLL